MRRRIVVVGGGYAGLLSAVRIARKTREDDAEILLIEARPWFVERVRLHQDVAGTGRARTSIASRLAGTRVGLRVGRVSEIDLARRRARMESGEDEVFDELVLATGSVAAKPAIPGIAEVWSCATEEPALALKARLEGLAATRGGRARIVIVGAGLTGIELAAELGEQRADLDVTLVTTGDVGFDLTPRAREHVCRALTTHGVVLRERARVAAIERDAVVFASGDSLASDVTIWAGGFAAAPLGRDAGLAVDENGRAHVDGRLRSTSHEFVHVIGDAARVMTPSASGDPEVIRMACATACPQGAFAAEDIARAIAGREPTTFSFGYPGRGVSLGRRDAIAQLTDGRDVARRFWLGGRTAAFLKEMICRFAAASSTLERRGIGYAWQRAPALAAGAAAPRLSA